MTLKELLNPIDFKVKEVQKSDDLRVRIKPIQPAF